MVIRDRIGLPGVGGFPEKLRLIIEGESGINGGVRH